MWRGHLDHLTGTAKFLTAAAKLLAHMRARIAYHNATTFTPDRGQMDTAGACAQAKANGGVWGPWLP